MNEQIEEMANAYYDAMLKARGTLGSMNDGAPKWYAKELYAKGYRKASEGKWKPYKDYFTHRQVGWICSNCSSVTQDLSNGDTDYCPHCGAAMETESEGAGDEH